jgi:hypothetical protein
VLAHARKRARRRSHFAGDCATKASDEGAKRATLSLNGALLVSRRTRPPPYLGPLRRVGGSERWHHRPSGAKPITVRAAAFSAPNGMAVSGPGRQGVCGPHLSTYRGLPPTTAIAASLRSAYFPLSSASGCETRLFRCMVAKRALIPLASLRSRLYRVVFCAVTGSGAHIWPTRATPPV